MNVKARQEFPILDLPGKTFHGGLSTWSVGRRTTKITRSLLQQRATIDSFLILGESEELSK